MVNRVDLDNDLALTIFGDEESTRVFVPLNTLKKVCYNYSVILLTLSVCVYIVLPFL